MLDNLPNLTPYWAQLETYLRELAYSYAYHEIRLPLVEKTALFQHSIGTVTDIIEKEMYSFNDSKGQSLSLRPEGTASCVRAAIEHQLLAKSTPQRLWYVGPMFRRERPQKGRYRQFHQFGVEVFGITQPEIDAEIIAMSHRLWKKLGIEDRVTLQINSLGSYKTRECYRAELIQYFTENAHLLDEDSKRRLSTNPLRILDSKNPKMIAINQAAPLLLNYLDEASQKHFSDLQRSLDHLNIPFTINPQLVRGLDYYNRTVFEWIIRDTEGAQNTVCAGGRYDGLVKNLGGPDKSAVGFAIGLERLLELWLLCQSIVPTSLPPHVYLIQVGEQANLTVLKLAEKLRSTLPRLRLEVDYTGGRLSHQFKRASESRAAIALILGENEIKTETFTVKPLQDKQPQMSLSWTHLIDYLIKTHKLP
jgi:histidyl-tRNA synthetase